MKSNTKAALLWAVDILEKNQIPFRLSGGFAAKLYGSPRHLNDIDIEVPDNALEQLQPFVQEYIVWGPGRYKDEEFDLPLMTLKYQNQEIDLSGVDSERVFNKSHQKWEDFKVPIAEFTLHIIDGKQVPVIKKKHLVAYKTKIQRAVDLEDIQNIQFNEQITF